MRRKPWESLYESPVFRDNASRNAHSMGERPSRWTRHHTWVYAGTNTILLGDRMIAQTFDANGTIYSTSYDEVTVEEVKAFLAHHHLPCISRHRCLDGVLVTFRHPHQVALLRVLWKGPTVVHDQTQEYAIG